MVIMQSISDIYPRDRILRSASHIAACMYHTGIDPFGEVHIAKGLRDRKMQRALLQFFKLEDYFTVREGLLTAGRGDLIGNGCACLIPARPSKAAIEARMRRANEIAEVDHYHSIANPAKASRSASVGCRIRVTDLGGRRRGGGTTRSTIRTGKQARGSSQRSIDPLKSRTSRSCSL